MSEVPDHLVHKGFWINHSYGTVLGSTITTDTATGNVLIALLAILISIAFTHLWNLCLFGYHQFRADGKGRSAYFRQQQVLLRALPAPDSLFVDLMRLATLWRSKMPSTFRQCLVPLLLALAFWLGSVVAGVTSSFAIKSNNVEVLIRSPGCGYMADSSQLAQGQESNAYINALEQTDEQNALYAKSCYLKNSASSLCRIFVKPRIPFSAELVHCPFSSSICLENGTLGLSMDTGLLDANQDFGINLKPMETVKLRYKTTCGPIQVAGRYEYLNITKASWDFPNPLPGEQKVAFYYGPPSEFARSGGVVGNNSIAFSTYQANTTYEYILRRTYAYADSRVQPPRFLPISELRRDDADTVLFVIEMGAGLHPEPIEDPVFSAHQRKKLKFSPSGPEIGYGPDHPGGAIACAEQTQFCIPENDSGNIKCTELAGAPADTAILPQASKTQRAVVEQFIHYRDSISDNAGSPISMIQANILGQNDIAQVTIPKNQWEIEVQGFFGFFLGQLQANIANYATGVKADSTSTYKGWLTDPPATPEEKYLCNSIKMQRSSGFTNVNVLAVALIVGCSIALAILDMTILKFVIFMDRVHKRLSPRIDRWIQDGVLQLHRRAYEDAGESQWTRLDSEIPIMKTYELLPDLTTGDVAGACRTRSVATCTEVDSTSDETVSEKVMTKMDIESATWSTDGHSADGYSFKEHSPNELYHDVISPATSVDLVEEKRTL